MGMVIIIIVAAFMIFVLATTFRVYYKVLTS